MYLALQGLVQDKESGWGLPHPLSSLNDLDPQEPCGLAKGWLVWREGKGFANLNPITGSGGEQD